MDRILKLLGSRLPPAQLSETEGWRSPGGDGRSIAASTARTFPERGIRARTLQKHRVLGKHTLRTGRELGRLQGRAFPRPAPGLAGAGPARRARLHRHADHRHRHRSLHQPPGRRRRPDRSSGERAGSARVDGVLAVRHAVRALGRAGRPSAVVRATRRQGADEGVAATAARPARPAQRYHLRHGLVHHERCADQ